MAKSKNAATDTGRRPRFDNNHFRPDVMYGKALMGRYPSAEKWSPHRSGELRYWYDRCVAAAINPVDVELRCPLRVRAEAEAITRGAGK